MQNRRILIAALLGGVVYASVMVWVRSQEFAWDFAINWTAARGLRRGISLYDWESLRQIATAEIGPPMDSQFSGPFSAYISPPSTALFLLPFSYLPFSAALFLYRTLQLLLVAGALWITGLILPAADRFNARALGALAALYLPMLSSGLARLMALFSSRSHYRSTAPSVNAGILPARPPGLPRSSKFRPAWSSCGISCAGSGGRAWAL
jgi:hypothetical protein